VHCAVGEQPGGGTGAAVAVGAEVVQSGGPATGGHGEERGNRRGRDERIGEVVAGLVETEQWSDTTLADTRNWAGNTLVGPAGANLRLPPKAQQEKCGPILGVTHRSHDEWVLWNREVGDGEVEEDRGTPR
jgi:hypothetical protein